MRGIKNGKICIWAGLLSGMVLLIVGSIPVYAGEYTLTSEVFQNDQAVSATPVLGSSGEYSQEEFDFAFGQGDYDEDLEDNEEMVLASGSNARRTRSTASASDVSLLSAYNDVYDGSMSSSVIQYFKDIVSKLPSGMDYVFFRQSQYVYRLVYSDELEISGSSFVASDASYVTYDTRYYTFSEGSEGTFRLNPSSYLVYTSLSGMYPTLDSGVRNYEFKTLLFMLGFGIVFNLVHGFFFVGRYRI